MDIPLSEQRRLKITNGVLSSDASKLSHLAASHPFTQQIDVTFPSSDVLESALSKLQTRYCRCEIKLSDIVDTQGPFSGSFLDPESSFMMLSTNGDNDDVWCIDPRGTLTLSVSKDTYEKLGLVGKKLPFKTHADQHVIRLTLRKHAESPANKARQNDSLRAWDKRREQDGLGAWSVLYTAKGELAGSDNGPSATIVDAKCQVARATDIHIPVPLLAPHPSVSKSASSEEEEDWNIGMAALFEWVGMATLGSQRLHANDRTDPYVSVYDCPTPSYVGNITHLQWRGFLGPGFIQSIIDTALECVKTHPTLQTSHKPFVAITSHVISTSPVSYIPPTCSGAAPPSETPMRLPRKDGEDTWCLVAVPGLADLQTVNWSLAESVGQWDTRWG